MQAFVVAGGYKFTGIYYSSVMTLLPGADAWTLLASLPKAMYGARASIVRGRLRLTGGFDGSSFFSEVMIDM